MARAPGASIGVRTDEALAGVALGGLLALVALGVVLALVQPPMAGRPRRRADALAAELRCPDCQGLSVADSHDRGGAGDPAPDRRAGRRRARRDAEVRDHFVARYGEWILLAPAQPLYWVIPFAVVLAGDWSRSAAWLVRRRASARRVSAAQCRATAQRCTRRSRRSMPEPLLILVGRPR